MERWIDQLSVRIRFSDHQMTSQPDDEVWVFDIHSSSVGSDDAADVLVEALGADGDPMKRPPFALDQRHHTLSWGASAASEQIVLTVGASLVTLGIRSALAGTFREILRRYRRHRQPLAELTRAEAEARARWLLTRHFREELEPDQLELVSEEERPGEVTSWTFTFRLGAETLTAEIADHDGFAVFVRFSRVLTDSSAFREARGNVEN